MANLQVKNVPDDIHRRLRRHAKEQRRTIGELVLQAVRRELQRQVFVEQRHLRAPAKLRSAPADLLAAERRDRGLGP